MYSIALATLALLLTMTSITALAAMAYTLLSCPEYFGLEDYLRACREFEALRARHCLTGGAAPSYRSYRTASEVRTIRLALPAPQPAPRRFCLPSAPANDVSTLVHEAPTRVDRAPASPAASWALVELPELPELPEGAEAVLDAMLPSTQKAAKGPRERNTRALAIALTRLARTAPYALRAPGASGDTAAYRPMSKRRAKAAKRTCDPKNDAPTRKYALGG